MGGGGFKAIIPLAASALGAYFLGPAIGAAIGGTSGAAAGTAIGGAVGGLAGQAVAGMDKGVSINMPGPSSPNAMPIVGGSGTEDAQAKTLATLRARQGRAASILSQGGVDNTSSKLGG